MKRLELTDLCPCAVCPSAAAAARLRLQPLSRLRDGEDDEGEALLRRLQHRTGAEAGAGDDGAGGVVHGQSWA